MKRQVREKRREKGVFERSIIDQSGIERVERVFEIRGGFKLFRYIGGNRRRGGALENVNTSTK